MLQILVFYIFIVIMVLDFIQRIEILTRIYYT